MDPTSSTAAVVPYLAPPDAEIAHSMIAEDELDPGSKTNDADNKVLDDICKWCKTGNSRRLVVCIDGTSNQFGQKNSNVVEIYKRIEKSKHQLTYYNSGIGTYARKKASWAYLRQRLDNGMDLLIAWHLKRRILDAYTWLSNHYEDGDQIYLFGFSRGAYQVRALAAMIETVGLIHCGNKEQIPYAYQLYISQNISRSQDLAKNFKATFSRPVKIHFVGVWDTVSSVGVIGRRELLPLTNKSDHICFFRHALALDELRVKFLPEFVALPQDTSEPETVLERGDTTGPTNTVISGDVKMGEPSQDRVKEVWFAGSHSDIGGGIDHNLEANLGAVPVLWMANQAMLAGLQLRYQDGWNLKQIRDQAPHKSMKKGWWLLEILPIRHLQPGSNRKNLIRRYNAHLCRGRVILDEQKIHASVALKPHSYQPRATGVDWGELRGDPEFDPNNLETDAWLKYASSLTHPRWDKDIYDFGTTVPFWLDQVRKASH
ncbi:hypothetical protein CPB86DRAFT_324101 [Serendipita vermifera]|nr:hypothetical protein CPB86DRAFT_324101 [Serendipita vermifera]